MINDQRRVCEMLYVNVFGKILTASRWKNSTTWFALQVGSCGFSRLRVVIMAVMRPPELVPAIKSKYSHRWCFPVFPGLFSSYSQPYQQPDVADPCQFPQESSFALSYETKLEWNWTPAANKHHHFIRGFHPTIAGLINFSSDVRYLVAEVHNTEQ
jgi:hypothetical protein